MLTVNIRSISEEIFRPLTTMDVIQIDLTKNPDVAALVADKQPGDKVYGCFTVKDKDDQTLSLRIKEMAATKAELPDTSDDSGEGGDEEMMDDEKAEPEQSPEGAEAEAPEPVARKLARQVESGPVEY